MRTNEVAYSNASLPSLYQQFIHMSRYSRFRDDLGRRENYTETVTRFVDFMGDHLTENFPKFDFTKADQELIHRQIHTLGAMPSMRALMTAGEALYLENVSGYNCAYLPVDAQEAFSEALYILMCGTGVGFSVERQYIQRLPVVPRELVHSDNHKIVVQDSKLGWAVAQKQLIALLYAGVIPTWDTSLVRPAGARLKTFGGRASGPEPLEELFRFTVAMFMNARGRRLESLECHDLMCKTGEIVVVGGVRRSAMISLSNLSDDRMRGAKMGAWWENYGHRRLANNSYAATEIPEVGVFMKEWSALYESKSGERGIFSRYGAQEKVRSIGRDANHDFGCNPCAEILLRPFQFCNLSEVVLRGNETKSSFMEKARAASIIGTFQSTLTKFQFLRPEWAQNCEEERLLGVSLTGIMDCPLVNNFDEDAAKLTLEVRKHVREVNVQYARRLGINPSAALTTVKPSGTVSQLVNSSSGAHEQYSHHYIRRVRADRKDPMTQFLIDHGVPHEPDVMKPDATVVFSFGISAPEGARVAGNSTAIEQLERIKFLNENWSDHAVSCTIYVKEHEWPVVGGWVYENFASTCGLSFFPVGDHTYRQAPYEATTKAVVEELNQNLPEVDWNNLMFYEQDDNTVGSQTFACAGGVCEIVDLTKGAN